MSRAARLVEPWRAAAWPAAFSLLLSALTVGAKPYWQDSSLYLVAVKEWSVLYPPGFGLYLILCKAWTLLLAPFLDFTLSVHLFSSVCAAVAAGFLARAAEKLSGDRLSGAVVGCLAAAGYTWWLSGITAKGYSLYFLVSSALLWRAASGDVARVLLLAALAWAAHPSAALLGPAVLAYLVAKRREVRSLGWKRSALLVAGALLLALGPSLVLPILAARNSVDSLGHPWPWKAWISFVAGSRFTAIPGVWGFVGWRWAHVGQYFWEEFLGVGGLLALIGAFTSVRERPLEAGFAALWGLPIIVGSALFKIEGQHDFWLVVAWMPLWAAAARGLAELRRRGGWAPIAGAAAGGLFWGAAANFGDLQLRRDDLPEKMGHCLLDHLEPNSTLLVSSDETIGLARYLQCVRGFRTDVRVLNSNQLAPDPEAGWYWGSVQKKWPDLAEPDFEGVLIYRQRYSRLQITQAAVANARKPGGPPVYFDREPEASLFYRGTVVPSGFLYKWTDREPARPDPRDWDLPLTLENVADRHGRLRGIFVRYLPDRVEVQPQSYDRRIVHVLAEARRTQAELLQGQGTPEGYRASAEAYESILKSDENYALSPRILYPLGLDYYMLDRPEQSAPLFLRVLDLEAGPAMTAGALFYLGEMNAAKGRNAAAQGLYRRALEIVPGDSPLRPELERRLR